MKQRPSFRILSLVIALILLFSAAPFRAQQLTTYVPITGFKFDRLVADENWLFSWDTIPDESSVTFQVKGGGYMQVWKTVYPIKIEPAGWKTELTMEKLNPISGYGFEFRLKLSNSDDTLRTHWKLLVMDSVPTPSLPPEDSEPPPSH